MTTHGSPSLSTAQLATLAAVGAERTAAVGDVLFDIGDATYPFVAIREGEVAILDAAGNELVRHGASSFLGELNLLSGQTVFLAAVATKPLRYVAVDREALRGLLFEDGLRARQPAALQLAGRGPSRRRGPAARAPSRRGRVGAPDTRPGAACSRSRTRAAAS